MLIFNTTFHVEEGVATEYLDFFKQTYIPICAESGFLFDPRFSKIMSHGEEGSVCYSLQFYIKNEDTLHHWLSNGGKELEDKLVEKFGPKVVGFITLMDEIEL